MSDTVTHSSDVSLRTQGIAKSFGGVAAVRAVDLSVHSGTITGLIGPNGAGKSTLFNLISGVIQPDAGRVELFGQDITGMPPHKLAHLGMVRTFQLSREFQRLTVLENLMLAPRAQAGEHLPAALFRRAGWKDEERRIRARADEVLSLANLDPVRELYAGELSGGQKKLLELARALMVDCPLILLDEPGAGVNPSLMASLRDLIAALNRDHGKTFVIVEHDMDLVARLCDPVVVMTDGSVLLAGSFAEVRQDPRVIEAYLGGALSEDALVDA